MYIIIKSELTAMDFPESKIEAYLLFSLALMLNIALFYGFATRPVITYSISTQLGYNETIDFSSEVLSVELEISNRGLSKARVEIVTLLYNMSLIDSGGMGSTDKGDYLEVWDLTEKSLGKLESESRNLTISNIEESNYIVLILTVRDTQRLNPVTGFHESFALFRPERPNAILLRRETGEVYKRVRRRY